MSETPDLTVSKVREKSSKEDSTNEDSRVAQSSSKGSSVHKGAKPKTAKTTCTTTSQQGKDTPKEAGSSGIGLSASALGGIITDALKSSFEGLKDSMNSGFADLGNAIASQYGKGAIDDAKNVISITELAQLIGILVSSLPGVQFGKLHYREVEIEKNSAVRENKGNFDSKTSLSAFAKAELAWWVENGDQAFNPVSHGNPSIEIRTDASKRGGMHTWMETPPRAYGLSLRATFI
ncbi:hypothetical protein AC249_AIPGENE23498 [Exaiptasia diaphana]|nr:hypothetical protein AC249_AIPGENE23498 [Exaiptasia diaphana]